MAFKFVTFAVLIAVANAGLLPAPVPAGLVHQHAALVHQPATILQQRYVQPAPVLQQIATPVLAKHIDDEYDPNPQYSYSYDIHDTLTGDAKNQQETRSGDVVQGRYSLIDADGYRRTVDYTADPIHGFNAVVNREPLGHAVAVAPVAKVIAPAQTFLAHQPAVTVAKSFLPAQPLGAYAQPLAYSQPLLQAPLLAKTAYVH